jgi:hypothetical protein
VFDNLRRYPILAIFGVAMRFLGKSPDILGIFAFWFLLPIFLLLLLATLAQTAVLLAVLSLGIVSSYFQPSERAANVLIKREKLVKALAIVFLVVLGIICFISAVKLFGAITKLFPGA